MRRAMFVIVLFALSACGCRQVGGEIYIGPLDEYCREHSIQYPDPNPRDERN